MPIINNKILFSAEERQFIVDKFNSPGHTHHNWGDEDLQDIRSKIRNFYRNEQNAMCAYCNSEVSLVSANNAHIEHIVPKSIHPQFMYEPKNLCVICSDCNEIKRNQEVLNEIPDTLRRIATRYPRSSGAFKIVHPFFDEYDEHIIKIGKIYIDKTQKGNFTIGACRLNRYIQQFGVDHNYIDDLELFGILTDLMSKNNLIDKAKLMGRLRDYLDT